MRASRRSRLLASLIAVLAAAPVRAQEPLAPKTDTPVFRSGAAVVLLDLVVRDKRGRNVPDLKPEEVEVYEEGTRCEIRDFRLVQGEGSPAELVPGETAAPTQQPDTARQANLVVLIFDQLSPTARELSQRAALRFLDAAPKNAWISVFLLDQSLSLLQPFTTDVAAVRRAALTATSGARKGSTEDPEALQHTLDELDQQAAAGDTAGNAASSNQGQGAANVGAKAAAGAQAKAQASMLRMSRDLQRQQQGETSLYPLLALMKGLGALQGRKTMLYFSEGLQVPPNLDSVFRAAVSEANRANVSVYAIDARGLDTTRQSEAAKQALQQASAATQRANTRRGGATQMDEVMASETAESGLRLNVQGTLADLSESTGGFLMSDTNDFKQPMERLASEVSTYYEVNYIPPSHEYDGKFRSIAVKVKRSGVKVQARSGYFALPPGQRSALLPFEMPLFAALDSKAEVHPFEYQVAALRFGATGKARDHVLIVEVPLRRLNFEVDKSHKTYKLHFSLLALVKDADGRVVERFSEDYPFEGPTDKLEALKLGNVVFKRTFRLAPGKYSLEVVADDVQAGSASVQRAPLDVPAPSSLALSSISVIRRLEPAPANASIDDPLRVESIRIVPNLDAPISAAGNPQISVFFTVYPGPGADVPKMALEFRQDGKTMGRATPELPAPDAKGRILYVGTFPTSSFKPGRYEVRASVTQDAATVEERASFTLQP
jgi:VWFA-related protein